MNPITPKAGVLKSENWYCLRSLPKQEHIAAANLRSILREIDVFCPRLRIKRRCSRGEVWFVEALFPGYLFAKFNPNLSMQTVKSVPGVKTVLSFGRITATIHDDIIAGLRADFDHNEIHEVSDDLRPGDEITLTSGPFQGIRANVIRLLPSSNRIQVLMELLGRTTPVEVPIQDVSTKKNTTQLLVESQDPSRRDTHLPPPIQPEAKLSRPLA